MIAKWASPILHHFGHVLGQVQIRRWPVWRSFWGWRKAKIKAEGLLSNLVQGAWGGAILIRFDFTPIENEQFYFRSRGTPRAISLLCERFR